MQTDILQVDLHPDSNLSAGYERDVTIEQIMPDDFSGYDNFHDIEQKLAIARGRVSAWAYKKYDCQYTVKDGVFTAFFYLATYCNAKSFDAIKQLIPGDYITSTPYKSPRSFDVIFNNTDTVQLQYYPVEGTEIKLELVSEVIIDGSVDTVNRGISVVDGNVIKLERICNAVVRVDMVAAGVLTEYSITLPKIGIEGEAVRLANLTATFVVRWQLLTGEYTEKTLPVTVSKCVKNALEECPNVLEHGYKVDFVDGSGNSRQKVYLSACTGDVLLVLDEDD